MTISRNILTSAPLSALAILSFFMALGSWRSMLMPLESAFQNALFEAPLANDRLIFIVYIVSSPIALAIGAIQFFPRFRNNSLVRHRWIGRVFGLSILTGGVSAVLLTFSMWDRPIAATGFLLLGSIWLWTTGYAIALARRGKIAAHKDWMIRSFCVDSLSPDTSPLSRYLHGPWLRLLRSFAHSFLGLLVSKPDLRRMVQCKKEDEQGRSCPCGVI